MAMSSKKKILLYGPMLLFQKANNAYGGGVGGYTRNMSVYLTCYQSNDFKFIPCFHTVRGALKLDNFVWRMIIDVFRFIRILITTNADIVHVLAQYRMAISREFVVCLISKLFKKPFVYEVKAGSFITWYNSTNFFVRLMIKFIIISSDVILVEGKAYLSFIKDNFNRTAYYFPNFVPISEVPSCVPVRLTDSVVKILFVGYCYKSKGIFELIEGCNRGVKSGVKIELSVIGQESLPYKEWLDNYSLSKGLVLRRLGRLPHREVLRHFSENDIYFYPTSHPGEGHNNSINEAMMMGLIIATTRHGFLEAILEDRAYFVEERTPACIADLIIFIDNNREDAVKKAISGYRYLRKNLTSDVAFSTLNDFYRSLTS
ncbi:MAG: glycosyltransferase [Candidatus Electrothrix sp. AR1]|nr:glycosyltransferase [Candidatus Electrothrix sp. AR1]